MYQQDYYNETWSWKTYAESMIIYLHANISLWKKTVASVASLSRTFDPALSQSLRRQPPTLMLASASHCSSCWVCRPVSGRSKLWNHCDSHAGLYRAALRWRWARTSHTNCSFRFRRRSEPVGDRRSERRARSCRCAAPWLVLGCFLLPLLEREGNLVIAWTSWSLITLI